MKGVQRVSTGRGRQKLPNLTETLIDVATGRAVHQYWVRTDQGGPMKSAKFFIPLFLSTAGVASADCSDLNSTDFLEQTPWEQVLECVEDNPARIRTTDSRGYNLLMTAAVSDIHPLGLDDLLDIMADSMRDDVMNARDRNGRSLGHIAAAEAKDPAVIFVLSAHGVSLLDKIDKGQPGALAGRTPLHFAAERADGWRFVAALLATSGLNEEDEKGITPFDLASKKEVVEPDLLLLADGEWPFIYKENFEPTAPTADAECSKFLTADFFLHAEEGDVVACLQDQKQLLAVDKNGDSILHLAATYASDEWIVDHILATADDPVLILNKRNSAGKTPLHLAAESGKSAELLLHLLAWGADPDALYLLEEHTFGKDRGVSALHMAVDRQDDLRYDMISILLAFGADATRQTPAGKDANVGGRTPLHRALLQPDPIVLLMLLEGQFWQESLVGAVFRAMLDKGVKQIEDDAGRTALHMAASRPSDIDTLWFLINYGFSVDGKDDEGNTPLMFAAQNFSDAGNFLYLLDQATNPCGSSKAGATVEAALRKNAELSQVGADDATGMTLSPLAKLKQRCP